MTFVFYDTETTGLKAAFDQVVQFAAIVTDDEFVVLEELNLRCRLKPHVIASPGAMLITNVGPRQIQSAPLSCYQMTAQIRAFIERWTPAVLIGFNSISFDENMLRHLFFQGLHPTYLTNTNGNSRMDVMRLAHAVAAHEPGALIVPLKENGRPSFRLGDLVKANGIALDNAHDALADTRATIELAKFLKERAPTVWEDLFSCRSRHAVEALLAKHQLFLITDQTFKRSTILAGAIATHPVNPAAVAFFDLEYDPGIYLDADKAEMQRLLKASPRPIRVMKTNALPIIAPVREKVPEGADTALALERLKHIRQHKTFAETISFAMAAQDENYEAPDHLEQSIYSGFPCRRDQELMEDFHRAPWQEKHRLLEQFEDIRFLEFGERILYAEFPSGLPPERLAYMKAWHRQRYHSKDDVPWLTISKGIAELEAARTNAPASQAALIEEIDEYFVVLDAMHESG